MRISSFLVLLPLVVASWAQTEIEPRYEGSAHVMSYVGGYFINWDDSQISHGTIRVYGPDAKPLYSDPLSRPGDSYYLAWAIDSDGTALRLLYSHGIRIELLDRLGKPTLTINPLPFYVTNVTFGPDHTIWTIGYEHPSNSPEEPNVICHYSRTGEKLGKFTDWAQIAGFPDSYPWVPDLVGGQRMHASKDRIGLEAQVEKGHGTWIEVSYDGKLLGTYDLGSYTELHYRPVVMTPDGDVYARIWKNQSEFGGYARLDRSQKTWTKLSGYPKGRLIGADDESLIFAESDGVSMVLHSVPARSLSLEPLKAAEVSPSN